MRDYVITRETENPEDDLEHYGVLGMKWGVKRGKTAQVFQKAQKKMTKLDTKSQKALKKRYKRSNPLIRTEISDARYKSAVRKSDKAKAKANKWYKKVEKTLGSEVASKLTNADGTKAGERYVNNLLHR